VCDAQFAHPCTIQPGGRTLVTTCFASDEHARHFGVPPLTQVRRCLFCTGQKLRDLARTGHLDIVKGLTSADLAAAGVTEAGTAPRTGGSPEPVSA